MDPELCQLVAEVDSPCDRQRLRLPRRSDLLFQGGQVLRLSGPHCAHHVRRSQQAARSTYDAASQLDSSRDLVTIVARPGFTERCRLFIYALSLA